MAKFFYEIRQSFANRGQSPTKQRIPKTRVRQFIDFSQLLTQIYEKPPDSFEVPTECAVGHWAALRPPGECLVCDSITKALCESKKLKSHRLLGVAKGMLLYSRFVKKTGESILFEVPKVPLPPWAPKIFESELDLGELYNRLSVFRSSMAVIYEYNLAKFL